MGNFDLQFGDGFQLVKNIPTNSVDLIITDPPYGINFTKGYKSGSTELVQGDDGFTVMFFLDDILREYRRILKPNSAIYIFTRFDVMPYWWIKMKNYFDCKNQIVWFKGGGGMGDLKGNFSYNYESIMFATNGKHLIRGKRDGSVWQIGKTAPELHETQKPVELIEKIIEHSSDEGMTIFDPFMGSGTTGIACKNLNRNFIGIELNEEYFNVAKKRINNHKPQLKFNGFTETEERGAVLNSFSSPSLFETENEALPQARVIRSVCEYHYNTLLDEDGSCPRCKDFADVKHEQTDV